MERLSAEELSELVIRVFQPRPTDTAVAVMVDLPDASLADTEAWRQRREMAADWAALLAGAKERLGLETHLVLYRNARMNNADLPQRAHLHAPGEPLPRTADDLHGEGVAMGEVLAGHSILLAPTELSATAPLKLTAKEHGFRAATMPGFSPAMIPALRLDYGEISRRCLLLKGLLDRAAEAAVQFEVRGQRYDLLLDLRHRTAHASGGLFPDLGVAGNLPSGETYIVPYEGEVADQPSRTAGVLPVQFDNVEVVFFEVEGNSAVRVRDGEAAASRERTRLADEPAYGNMAELGLGVLADFGLQPSGDLLLDEKLGLHIAFGRSDHFGGQTGAAAFSCAEAVVHIDRVYLPSTQPLVKVPAVDLRMDDGSELPLIRDHAYVIDWE